jgi:hypothetical protein
MHSVEFCPLSLWLDPPTADPHGKTLAAVRRSVQNLGYGLQGEALFVEYFRWDSNRNLLRFQPFERDLLSCGGSYMCLPQKHGTERRTKEEAARFARGLDVMGSLYASLTATLVIQKREHDILDGLAEYTLTPYAQRGWPRFEEGVAKFVAAHLARLEARGVQWPERLARVRESPKLRTIDGASAEPVQVNQRPSKLLQETMRAVAAASFQGKDVERSKVQTMLVNIEWQLRFAILEQMEKAAEGEFEPDPARVRSMLSHQQALDELHRSLKMTLQIEMIGDNERFTARLFPTMIFESERIADQRLLPTPEASNPASPRGRGRSRNWSRGQRSTDGSRGTEVQLERRVSV